MKRSECSGWWSLAAFVAAVTLAICTAEYGDGLRYVMQQYLLSLWS